MLQQWARLLICEGGRQDLNAAEELMAQVGVSFGKNTALQTAVLSRSTSLNSTYWYTGPGPVRIGMNLSCAVRNLGSVAMEGKEDGGLRVTDYVCKLKDA